MEQRKIYIGICISTEGWHELFAETLEQRIKQGCSLEYHIIDPNRHDWLSLVSPCDLILWKPAFMGSQFAGHFKEKIYFLEKHLGKIVVPNYNSVWHFESKAAQSYLFSYYNVHTPSTTCSFDYHNAIDLISKSEMPLVFKLPYGAGSRNVRLVNSLREASIILESLFCQQLWDEAKSKHQSKIKAVVINLTKKWLWSQLKSRILGKERFGIAYWQEFIPGNQADLRITVIGDRFAFAFWRRNRPNDFRASGSGNIDYVSEIPVEPLLFCRDLNRHMGFDSMAYDILFSSTGFMITEMSFGYLSSAIHNTKGYYLFDKEDVFRFIPGRTWPQTLWVDWALHKVGLLD